MHNVYDEDWYPEESSEPEPGGPADAFVRGQIRRYRETGKEPRGIDLVPRADHATVGKYLADFGRRKRWPICCAACGESFPGRGYKRCPECRAAKRPAVAKPKAPAVSVEGILESPSYEERLKGVDNAN